MRRYTCVVRVMDLELLKKLVEIPAPSGHEDKMIAFLKEYLREYVDELTIDKIGNVIALISGEDKKAP